MNRQDRFAEHTFSCTVCDKPAGHVRISEEDGALPLVTESFQGTTRFAVQAANVDTVLAAVASGDSATLFARAWEAAPFYCPSCDANYCRDHWHCWDKYDADMWWDSLRGRCPHGHERMLAD